ncbi:RNase H domain-containing protein [Trichonephila clavipes]|nr:RNase H domain-containing protein [Trichonephila clavipes]
MRPLEDAGKNRWIVADFSIMMVVVYLGPQQIGRTDRLSDQLSQCMIHRYQASEMRSADRYPELIFQQENAKPHTTRVAKNCLTAYQTLPWPASSPDPSPIEHVWDMMGRQLHLPGSVDDLIVNWSKFGSHTQNQRPNLNHDQLVLYQKYLSRPFQPIRGLVTKESRGLRCRKRNKHSRSGSGVYIKSQSYSSRNRHRNSDVCSVFRSELIANDTSLKEAVSIPGSNSIWILSDSRSAIQHLSNWHKVGDNTRVAILEKVKRLSSSLEIHLQWVLSHVNITGNEIADFLAKGGVVQPTMNLAPLTYSELHSTYINNKQ